MVEFKGVIHFELV